MPLNERAEQGVRPHPDTQLASPEVTVNVKPARLATTNITNWKLEQQRIQSSTRWSSNGRPLERP